MNHTKASLRGKLFYIQLGSADPERLVQFHERIFGLTASTAAGSWICRSPSCCVVVSRGEPKTLLSAGYAVADSSMLEGLSERASAYEASQTLLDAELFEPGSIALRDPDGNRIVYGVPRSKVAARSESPPARLQHVVLGSTDINRMVAFYSEVVGLRISDEVRDEQGALRTCFMRSDREHHSLAVFATATNRLDHHCYELPDWNAIRDWGDRLAGHRVPVKWGPGRHGPGNNLFLFFHDPDDNWLELSAELEVVPEDRPAGTWPHEERTLNSWGRGYLRS